MTHKIGFAIGYTAALVPITRSVSQSVRNIKNMGAPKTKVKHWNSHHKKTINSYSKLRWGK